MADAAVASIFVELRADISNLRTELNAATAQLKATESKVGSITKGISTALKGAFAFAGGAIALIGIKKLGDAVLDLAKKGEAAGSIRDSFEKLGGSSSAIAQAKEATLGLVSSFDLMQIANSGLLRQIPDFNNQFATIADVAARVADATGGDTKQAIEGLTSAIAAGKPKMLEQFGLLIDAEKAYKNYATANKLAGDSLTDLQKKEAVQLAALDALKEKQSQLAPIGDSVANAWDAMGVALDEVQTDIGIAINENENLRTALRNMNEQLSKIDWAQFANDISEAIATIVNFISEAIPKVQQFFHEFVRGAKIIGETNRQLGDKGILKIGEAYSSAVAEIDKAEAHAKTMEGLEGIRKDVDTLTISLAKARSQADLSKLTEQVLDLSKRSKEAGLTTMGLGGEVIKVTELYNRQAETLPEVAKGHIDIAKNSARAGDVSDKAGKKGEAAAKKIADANKKAKEEVQKLAESFVKLQRDLENSKLEEVLKSKINLAGAGKMTAADQAEFNKTIEQLKVHIGTEVQAGLSEGLAKGAIDPKAAEAYKNEMINNGVKPWIDDMKEQQEEAAKQMQEAYSSVFDDLGGEFAGILGQIDSDLGEMVSTISDALSDETKAGIMQGLASAFGYENSEAGAQAFGAEAQGYMAAGSDVLEASLSAKDTDKKNKSNKGTGGAVGAGIGAAIGGAFGGAAGAQIGAQIGKIAGELIGDTMKWGPQNKETIARHAFANFVEDQFKKLGEVSFYDTKNKLQSFQGDKLNFLEGPSNARFNQPGWAEDMNKWGGEARSTFTGLGEALEEVLGLTEDVGAQIGFMMGENLAGSIDNARLMVQYLGLDLQELEDALVETGLRGEMSWHEVEVALQGVHRAFEPGLEAVGAFDNAFQNLIDSGGRGMDAVKAFRDIAVEAQEAGIKTMDELKNHLLAKGMDPAMVDSLMQAVAGRGIETIQQWAEASNRTAGGVIADIESLNKVIADQWHEAAEVVKDFNEEIAKLPDRLNKSVTIDVEANISDDARRVMDEADRQSPPPTEPVRKNAKGAVVSSSMLFRGGAGLEMMGEAGPEAILPLSKVGGKLGVAAAIPGNMGAMNIMIDARGADAGVEHRVRRAIREAEDRAIAKTLRIVGEGARRGGRMGDSF